MGNKKVGKGFERVEQGRGLYTAEVTTVFRRSTFGVDYFSFLTRNFQVFR